MSTTTDLGKVGMTPKQIYDSTTTYERLDVVTHHGCSYVCLKDCAGIEVTNTEYWQLLADKGHFTEQDKEAFKQAVVTDSKIEINEHTEAKKTELDNYTSDFETSLKNELDTYEIEKEAQLDIHKSTLETEMTNTKDSLVEEIETAQNGFNDNVTAKTTAFDNNVTTKTTAFNNNVTQKTNTFNSNVETKTTEFNNNVTAKIEEYNNNSATKLEAYNNNATEKTNSFNSNAEEKTTEFNENAESYEKRIAELETENEDLYNSLDTEKASGTEIYVDNAKECRLINASISGMYKQSTTLGINIDNTKLLTTVTRNGITRTILDDGGIKITGTATANWNMPVLASEQALLEEGPYTFVCYGLPTSLYVNIYYIGNVTGETIRKFTADGTSLYYMNLTITEGTTVDYTIYPFLIKGSYDSSTIPIYEKYTGGQPSPNPDYKQEIEQVESVELNGIGENYVSTLLEDLEQGTITGNNGTNNTVMNRVRHNKFFSIDYDNVKTNYTILIPDGYKMALRTYDKDKKFNGSLEFSAFLTYLPSFYVGTGVKYIRLIFAKNDDSDITPSDIANLKFMIAKGTDKIFSQYRRQTIDIDLKDNKLCAVSNTVKDKLLIDRKGNVAIYKNVNKIILDGSEYWVLGAASNEKYSVFQTSSAHLRNLTDELTGISNKFIYKSNFTDLEESFCFNSGSPHRELRICILNSRLENYVEEGKSNKFKSWIKDNNIELYYKAKETQIIELGQLTENIRTFNGVNNIWVETNLGNTEIEIEYVEDIKKEIENLKAMIIANATEEV